MSVSEESTVPPQAAVLSVIVIIMITTLGFLWTSAALGGLIMGGGLGRAAIFVFTFALAPLVGAIFATRRAHHAWRIEEVTKAKRTHAIQLAFGLFSISPIVFWAIDR
jgi:hypothetical protein